MDRLFWFQTSVLQPDDMTSEVISSFTSSFICITSFTYMNIYIFIAIEAFGWSDNNVSQ